MKTKNIFFFCMLGLLPLMHAQDNRKLLGKAGYDHRALSMKNHDGTTVEPGMVFVSPGTVLSFSGDIAQEHVAIRNGRTLNEEVKDWAWKFRQRIDLVWHSEFFTEKSKKPAAEAKISFLNMHWWKEAYSNLYIKTEPAFITNNEATGHFVTPDNTFDKVSTAFYEPLISSHIPVFSFTQAWLAAYLHRWIEPLAYKPHFVKVGYFPYQVGRGITLGTADEGGIEYFGYSLSALPYASPYFSPGVLWHGTIAEKVSYELYYSLLLKRYNPPFTRDALFFRFRLDKENINRFGKDVSSQVWSAKVMARLLEAAHRSLYSEGYVVWHHASLKSGARDQNIVDRTTDVGSFGCMLDFKYKQLHCNIECAGQIGAVDMHSYDKNDLRLHRANTGIATAVCTHVKAAKMNQFTGLPITFEDTPSMQAVATDGLLQVVNNPLTVRLPSDQAITAAPGSSIVDLATGYFVDDTTLSTDLNTLWNTGAPTASAQELLRQAQYRYVKYFNAQDRVRKQFKVGLQGFLCAADLAYVMKKHPCSLHLAGAYISGDTDPFAAEKDATYKGFLPLRDINYKGHFVKSLAVLGARILPRPCAGQWHAQDSSNLAYCGVGFQAHPLQDRSQFSIESNLLWFFQPAEQGRLRVNEEENINAYASKDLGVEWNATLTYHPLKNMTLMGRGALFFPGKLYKDREAQMMQLMTVDGTLKDTKIGSDVAWGYHIRLAYHF